MIVLLAQGRVAIPLPDVTSRYVFWGVAAVFVAYLLAIFLRKPKSDRPGAAAPEREL